TGAKLYPEGSEAQITRLVQRPKYRRIYLRILEQMLKTSWDSTYMGRYLTQTQSVTGRDGSGILGFINARRASVAAQVPSNVVFRATRLGTSALPAQRHGGVVAPTYTEGA